MLTLKKRSALGLILILLAIAFSACGPSQEELAATSAAETKAAASPTPLPTGTPTPTSSPTPTPTPTPVPSPDAKAMINWEALNLPRGYVSFNPIELGLAEGDWIMGAQQGDGTQIDYYIENSFIFAEQWPEAVYGWTVKFPAEYDQQLLDAYIEIFPDQLAGIVNSFGATLISLIDNSDYPEYKVIGDNSAEAWAVYAIDGWWSFWGAAFRIGDIGGFVFLRHAFGNEPFIEIGDLAQIYAQSIETPSYSCNFSAISPNSEYDVPAFEYKLEGFYPGEPLMIGISGDVMVDGESERITIIDEDPFLTDEKGMYHGIMRFGDEVLEFASSEFELYVISYASKCSISQIADWPGDSSTSVSELPQTDPDSSAVLYFNDEFDQQPEDGWEWLLEEPDEWNYDSMPGYLHFDLDLYTEQHLVRIAPEGDFSITSRVLFLPRENFQFAGISILQDDEHKLMFGRAYAYFPDQDCCIGNALYYDNQDKIRGTAENGYLIESNYATKTDELSEAYLRLTREGSIYTAYTSSDGETWILIGIHEVDWVPIYVGIVGRGNQSASTISADFDYFTIESLP